MTDGQANRDTAPVLIGGRGYSWTIEDSQLVVRNAQGGVLDPTAAEVVISLGGDEPVWLTTVEALRAAYRGTQTGHLDGVVAAASALATSTTQQAETARTTDDRSILLALAANGVAQVGANPLCDLGVWELVMEHRDPEVRWTALEQNELLPPQLWNYPDTETRERVARNPECPAKILAHCRLTTGPFEWPSPRILRYPGISSNDWPAIRNGPCDGRWRRIPPARNLVFSSSCKTGRFKYEWQWSQIRRFRRVLPPHGFSTIRPPASILLSPHEWTSTPDPSANWNGDPVEIPWLTTNSRVPVSRRIPHAVPP